MSRVRAIFSILPLFFGVITWSQSDPQASLPDFEIRRISVNSKGNDYYPVLIKGTLLFTSENRERSIVYFSSADSLSNLSNIFTARQVNDSVFSDPELLDKKLNRFFNCGPATADSSFSRLIFSSNQKAPFFFYTSGKKSRLAIFSSEKNKEKWSEKTVLPFCDKNYNYTHPSLTPGGDTLYFASDMPGGKGGFDIYYTILKDRSWSAPVNMESINTSFNELFPAVSPSGFSFASNRNGSLDIYFSDVSGTVSKADEPINSSRDDFGYFSEGEQGYFTSDREGDDNIYFFRQLFPSFKSCEPYVKDNFCFTFFEEGESFEEGMDLQYEWSFGDGTTAKGTEARHCFNGYGEYLVELNIIDNATNALFFNQASYPFTVEPTRRLHIEGPDTIPAGSDVTFYASASSLPDYSIDNYFWEVNNGELRVSGSDSIVLSRPSEGSFSLKMGVKATGAAGKQDLFCITKSIIVKKDFRLKIFPRNPVIASGSVTEEAQDTIEETAAPETGKQDYTLFLGVSDTLLNNASFSSNDTLRIENMGDSLYLYSVGKTKNKLDLIGNYREAHEMGFSGSRVTEVEDGKLPEADELAKTPAVDIEKILDSRLRKEQILASIDIFYGNNISTLTEKQKSDLRKLAYRYKGPGKQRLLIASFTDSKGNDQYNLQLSRLRSESVKSQFIAAGFKEENIRIEYYGRSVPQNMEPLADAQRRKSIIIIYEE